MRECGRGDVSAYRIAATTPDGDKECAERLSGYCDEPLRLGLLESKRACRGRMRAVARRKEVQDGEQMVQGGEQEELKECKDARCGWLQRRHALRAETVCCVARRTDATRVKKTKRRRLSRLFPPVLRVSISLESSSEG